MKGLRKQRLALQCLALFSGSHALTNTSANLFICFGLVIKKLKASCFNLMIKQLKANF